MTAVFAAGLDVRRSYSVGYHHTYVWRGCRRVAWGIGRTREAADAAAADQVRAPGSTP